MNGTTTTKFDVTSFESESRLQCNTTKGGEFNKIRVFSLVAVKKMRILLYLHSRKRPKIAYSVRILFTRIQNLPAYPRYKTCTTY